MAWGWVQGNAATSGGATVSSEPCAYSSNVTAGNLLIAVAFHINLNATGLATALTDSIGNTWAMATSVQSASNTYALYYAISKSTAADTVTYTPPGGASTTFMSVFVHEYSGLNLTLDKVATGTATSGTAVTGAAVTNFTNELLVGFVSFPSGTLTIDATYTGRESLLSADDQTADKLGASPGSYTFGGATGVSASWAALLATFYEAAHTPSGQLVLAGSAAENFTLGDQILRPSSDIATAGWTNTPLFSKINDQSDGTFITATLA